MSLITQYTGKYIQRIQELEAENQQLKSSLQTQSAHKTISSQEYESLQARHYELKAAYAEADRENVTLNKELDTIKQQVQEHFAKTNSMIFNNNNTPIVKTNSVLNLTTNTVPRKTDNKIMPNNKSGKYISPNSNYLNILRNGEQQHPNHPSPRIKRKHVRTQSHNQHIHPVKKLYSVSEESESLSELTESSNASDNECDYFDHNHNHNHNHTHNHNKTNSEDIMSNSINILKKLIGKNDDSLKSPDNLKPNSTFFNKYLNVHSNDNDQTPLQSQPSLNQVNSDLEILQRLINAFCNQMVN